MNFKKLIFITYIFSFLIGQAISTPKTIKPLVELDPIDEFSLVTFIGAEGKTKSGGVVDYKTVKLYSITKNNNLVDYKQIFEFPLSEESLSYFSGALLGDITGEGIEELVLFISNPNTGTQIWSFTINPGFSFTKLHDPYLIKGNQKQSTLLSSSLATIYEDKDKEIVITFGAPERKAVIVNYDGELNSTTIAKKFLANSVGVIKVLTPDLNNDNISDIYLLSNNPGMKEEKTYYSPGHEDTDDSKTIDLKENIKDICFAAINGEEKLTKIFLLDDNRIYIDNIGRYYELPIENPNTLKKMNNNLLLAVNKKGKMVLFDILNSEINIKQNINPVFNKNNFSTVEYLILKNNNIIISHNGDSEILLQPLKSNLDKDKKNIIQEYEIKDSALAPSLKNTEKEDNLEKGIELSIGTLEKKNLMDKKDKTLPSIDIVSMPGEELEEELYNQSIKINETSLKTTVSRDTLTVNVGERKTINRGSKC